MPVRVLVMGAGGHAAEVCSYLNAIDRASGAMQLWGCLDDVKPAGRYGPVVVLGGFDLLTELLNRETDALHCVTAVGDNATRARLVTRVEALGGTRIAWATVRHPAALVGDDVEIGAGTCLAPGAIVTARTAIGRHCILNVKASVSHDSRVGDFCNLNPGAVVAGNTTLGDGAYIGAGATVIDRVAVGPWSVVGAGAVVIRDLPARVTAVGVPARVVKQHEAGS